MKICFLIARPDAFQKVGGDTIQARLIADNIRKKRNFEIVIDNWKANWKSDEYDIVQIFNDRPIFTTNIIRKCSANNTKVILSPIHHSTKEVFALRIEMTRNRLLKSKLIKINQNRKLTNLLSHYINLIADLVLLMKYFKINHSKSYLKIFASDIVKFSDFKKMYQKVNHLIFLAYGEHQSLEEDLQIKIKNFNIIPNGAPRKLRQKTDENSKSRFPIIVVGRIEPRKRQLEIAKCAEKKSIPILFVGESSPTQVKYGTEFQRFIEESQFQKYIGYKSHKETIKLMSGAKVLFSASLAEVLSLVELEALSQGIWVVSSGAGFTSEYAKNNQYRIFNMNIDTGLETALELLQTQCSEKIQFISWEDVGLQYANIYSNLIPLEVK